MPLPMSPCLDCHPKYCLNCRRFRVRSNDQTHNFPSRSSSRSRPFLLLVPTSSAGDICLAPFQDRASARYLASCWLLSCLADQRQRPTSTPRTCLAVVHSLLAGGCVDAKCNKCYIAQRRALGDAVTDLALLRLADTTGQTTWSE